MTPQDNRRIENLERDVDDLRIRTNRMPVREAKVATLTGNVIYAQVNEASGVTSGDSTFLFDNAIGIVGSVPTDGEGTAQNQYGQVYADNDWVILSQRKDNKQWITERGGSAGTIIRRYQTTASKEWDNPLCDAVLLNFANEPDGVIKVADRPPAKHELIEGSRGWCFYKETVEEVDHYYILTADSPARWIEGPIKAAWPLSDESVKMVVNPESVSWWGASPSHMDPVTDEDDEIEIFDTLEMRSAELPIHTKVRAIWDEKRKKWVLEYAKLGAGPAQYGLLIADVPEATATYDATRSYIEHGYAADAVIPLGLVKEGGGDGGDQFKAEMDGESQKILPVVNPIWSTEIKAGTTTDADKPVIVRGYQDDWNIYAESSVTEERVFVLSQIYYPITIMKAVTTMTVTGSAFSVGTMTLLWGRDPGVSTIASVANPDGWEGDNGAYCLIMQLTDGTWQAIDLACEEA